MTVTGERAPTPEHARLADDEGKERGWRRWGHYLSERQWGTVREDYSADGDAWSYFPYETATSRAYRWGEDSIGGVCDRDQRLCLALALWSGLMWSKQFYHFDVAEWLDGDPGQPPPPPQRRKLRNADWRHLNNADIVAMPDKWEYPWYAAWDLGFHSVALAAIDPDFAKRQLLLLGRVWYLHPNGQIPAYEWNFSDVNPPVHAWATWRVFERNRAAHGGRGDLGFLERVFHKLMLNFTWWVNRKDADGRNIFQGGFLGLDNIGVFDRSKPAPDGASLAQADATAWMAMYALNLLRIALELARHNSAYQDIATKFFEHFLSIAEAMTNMGDSRIGLWDPQDEFFYDMLNPSDGPPIPLKIRSLVGLIPLFAVELLEPGLIEAAPDFALRLGWVVKYRPRLAALVAHGDIPGVGQRRLLALLQPGPLKAVLRRLLDETEFLSDYGVRALSRRHLEEPYVFRRDRLDFAVRYAPGESESRLFGGNSNWRGPIWLPVNFLIIESLRRFHSYYGADLCVECPTGSGRFLPLDRVADELGAGSQRSSCAAPTVDGPCMARREAWKTMPILCSMNISMATRAAGLALRIRRDGRR